MKVFLKYIQIFLREMPIYTRQGVVASLGDRVEIDR